jgi:riboflavin kinase/FMN adenylyltransferase
MPAGFDVPEGVFAGVVQRFDGTVHRSAISVGRRETFYGSTGVSLLEAFLLDFTDDLYGEVITVTLVAMLRGQERFDSIPGLIAQIELDVDTVRRTIDAAAVVH